MVRLRAGLIFATAERWVGFVPPDIKPIPDSNLQIIPRSWWYSEPFRDTDSTLWTLGDIEIFFQDHGMESLAIFGVSFVRAAVQAMLANSTGIPINDNVPAVEQQEPDSIRIAAGRPHAGAGTWRDAVIIAMWEHFAGGKWEPRSATAINKAMLEWIAVNFNETPSPNTTRPAAKLLWESFERERQK